MIDHENIFSMPGIMLIDQEMKGAGSRPSHSS